MKKKALLTGFIGVFLLIQPLGAQTWNATKRLTWTSRDSWVPAIAIDSSSNIHVVWFDSTPGNDEIYYIRSMNGGLTWGAVKRITWNSGPSYAPEIAVDSGDNIHVVWSDETPGNREIYYKKSTNAGVSWGNTKRLTWNPERSVAAVLTGESSSNIHVAWLDETPGNEEIYYKRSKTSGVTWETSRRLTWNSGLSNLPAIAAGSSSNIHLIWYDESPGNAEILYRRSTNSGVSWSGTRRITWNSGGSIAPKMAESSSNIHLAWCDGTPGNAEIFYRGSTNSGASWGGTKRITWNSGSSFYPAVAVDSNNHVHVVWEDNSYDSNNEIYHKKSTDGGATWSPYYRLTWNSGRSMYVNISIDSSNNIHIVWNDETPGNYEIYYKKGIQ